MGIRQARGIVPGILSQEDAGPTVRKYLTGLPVQGKVTLSGLITAPVSGDVGGFPGDPTTQLIHPDDLPMGQDTRQEAMQQKGNGIGWIALLAALALL